MDTKTFATMRNYIRKWAAWIRLNLSTSEAFGICIQTLKHKQTEDLKRKQAEEQARQKAGSKYPKQNAFVGQPLGNKEADIIIDHYDGEGDKSFMYGRVKAIGTGLKPMFPYFPAMNYFVAIHPDRWEPTWQSPNFWRRELGSDSFRVTLKNKDMPDDNRKGTAKLAFPKL